MWLVFKFLKWFFRSLRSKTSEYITSSVSDVLPVYKDVFTPERYIAGSDYHPSTSPPFQVEIYVRSGVEYVFAGCATRLGNYCLTATHVISGHNQVRIKNATGHFDVDIKNLKSLDHDISWFEVDVRLWSRLSVVSAKVSKVGVSNDTFVNVVSRGQKSIGLLKNHPAFGMLIYNGSTARGFSGAPYYLGSNILGVHVGAGSLNMGVDIQYIYAVMLRYESGYKPEATEDYIFEEMRRMAKAGSRFAYQVSPFSTEEIMVRIAGKVYMLDTSDHPDVYEYLDNDPKVDLWDKEASSGDTDYVDSGNGSAASASAGASGVKASTKDAPNQSLLALQSTRL